jgi:dual specificity MAP kinase phosphatase
LIHCRVGVSRSAAITICYVMKHLHYTLVEAYLYVRARRLNVIIQPNLKFMYEMLQLEQREKGIITITWPTLCSEVHNLNFGNSAWCDESE